MPPAAALAAAACACAVLAWAIELIAPGALLTHLEAMLSPMTGVLGVARLGAARTPQRGDRRSAAATPALPPNAALASTALVPHAGATRFRGLVNHGVTCFFNSVIQSLASVSALAEHLDRTTRMAERYDVATPVTDALRELIVQLNTPDARGAALAPRALMRALGNVSQSNGLRTLVSARQQQDAHELAVLLLTALDEEPVSYTHLTLPTILLV